MARVIATGYLPYRGSYASSPQGIAAATRAKQEQAAVRQRAAVRQTASQVPSGQSSFERNLAQMQRDVQQRNLARTQQTAIRQVGVQQASARQANIARQSRIEGIYSEMMQRYQPGGAFEKRGLGEIERAKTKGVGKQTQQMISSGMYGTTTTAGLGKQWEADVGAPARLRLEDIMQQRLTGIQQQKAGFLERVEDVYPDYSSLLQMLAR